jgi:hypothetical protein
MPILIGAGLLGAAIVGTALYKRGKKGKKGGSAKRMSRGSARSRKLLHA